MRLTPLDIRKQEFSRGFRGFDGDEVNAFLQMVANQWEELQDENRRHEERIRELENKLVHYEKVEEALQEALQTARETSRKALENAEEKAEMILSQAEARAMEIKREAEQERHELKRETVKLSGRRSEIVSRLRAFLMSEMELLARYEGDDPVGFIKLLPAEEKRVRQLSDRIEDAERRSAGGTASDEGGNEEEPWQEPVDRDDALGTGLDERMFSEEGTSHAARTSRSSVPDEEDTEHHRSAGPAPASPSEAASDAARPDSRSEPHREPETASEGETARTTEPSRTEPGRGAQGWTTRTVVPRPSDRQRPADGSAEAEPETDDADDDGGEAQSRRSSEEIEKIRRILSDLD